MRITRGDLLLCQELPSLQDDGKEQQKSAEGIVGGAMTAEGPNRREGRESLTFDDEGDADRMTEMSETGRSSIRQKRRRHDAGASSVTTGKEHSSPEGMALLEQVVARENMKRAYAQVVRNKGAAGIDEMTVEELRPHLHVHWERIKADLLNGTYRVEAVRAVEIPKPNGGTRLLGIPTVLDRLIQQALHQVLSVIYEPHFSKQSYGFRPGRSAQQAVQQARQYVADGKRWVVDIDLEKFFDRVNHDILMSRIARRIGDKRVLKLIRQYLQAGILLDGVISARSEGTPQGGPLSPLLSNILLDELDKELERRGHAFCRYADDCNIYVQSRVAGERVKASLTRFLAKRLRLRVNEKKSAVDRPWSRKFLGYSMTFHKQPRLKPAEEAVRRFKEKVRVVLRTTRGQRIKKVVEALTPLLRGWSTYFQLAEVKDIFEVLDGWIRRKLRCLLWRQWKRVHTRARRLIHRGLDEARAWRSATNGRGPWHNAGASHMNAAYPQSYFTTLGLPSLLQLRHHFQVSY
jgi:RNA-directed DNA polymerase